MGSGYTHNLRIVKENKAIKIAVKANDSNHAQAQAKDICRALDAEIFRLDYDKIKPNKISELFKKLAFNEFDYSSCFVWTGSSSNDSPCFYGFKKRFFIKPVILKYLDIPVDCTIRCTCDSTNCINPYHFKYVSQKNSKLTDGDCKLLFAYRNQGTTVKQISEILKVNRSTIYRILKNEQQEA